MITDTETARRLEEVRKLVAERVSTPLEEISLLSSLHELGLDSLELVELFQEASAQVAPIPREKFRWIETVADIVEAMA